MRKNIIAFVFINIFIITNLCAQNLEWGVNMFGFFDNREYKCSVQIPQTFTGTRLAPEIGLGWEEHHHLRVGVNGLYEFGEKKALDNVIYTAYYLYDWKPFKLYFGSFPRKFALDNFPAAFFYDSLNYYRPNVKGFFWQYHKQKNNISAFIDWTSRQTDTERETFIMGGSGIYHKSIFYGEFQYYMYHRAARAIPDPNDHLHDNGLFHAALGLDLSEKISLDTMYIKVGFLEGQERRRNDPGEWQKPKGILIEANIEWEGLGIKNTYYQGDGLMVFYKTPYNQNDLYWADPFYQATSYNRTDLYLNIIKSSRVNAKFIYSFHYVEGKMSDQQQLLININLGNDMKNDKKTEAYAWTKWIH